MVAGLTPGGDGGDNFLFGDDHAAGLFDRDDEGHRIIDTQGRPDRDDGRIKGAGWWFLSGRRKFPVGRCRRRRRRLR